MAKWIFLCLWLLSMIAFFTGKNLATSNYQGFFFLTCVLLGFGFFLAMAFFITIDMAKKNKQKKKNKNKKADKKNIENKEDKGPKRFLTILLGLAILFSAGLYVRAENIEKERKNKDFKSAPTPTTILQLTPTPTTKPKVYVNPDPIIPCTMSKECGGDIRQIKKSECTNGTCCQIGSTWIFYPSRDKCLQDQKASQPVVQQAPAQRPAQSTSKLNYYCYDNTLKYSYYTSSGEQCNKDNATSACKSSTKSSIYDPCMKKCLDTANENDSICIWAYFGANAAMENNPDLYQECIAETSKEHQQCMDTCSAPYQEALKKCY